MYVLLPINELEILATLIYIMSVFVALFCWINSYTAMQRSLRELYSIVDNDFEMLNLSPALALGKSTGIVRITGFQ